MPEASALRHKVAIVGCSETDTVGVLPDRSMIQLHAEAALNALADAGLKPSDVDGVATAGPSPALVAEYLGIIPRYVDGTSVGGCSFLIHVRHAVAAIASGMASVVIVTHGESGRSRVGVGRPAGAPAQPGGQFESPFGVAGPPSMFSIPVVRHMKKFGTTEEQLAQVAVSTRKWASPQPTRDDARPDHRRRRAVVADDCVAAAPDELLPRDGRWRRAGARQRGARPRLPEAAGLGPRRGRVRGARLGLAHARLRGEQGLPCSGRERLRRCRASAPPTCST